MDRVEIDKEIARLTAKRHELCQKEDLAKIEKIRNLDWTKGCQAWLRIEPICGAGLPKYKVIVAGCEIPDFPYLERIVEVMGSSKNYENNITLHKDSYDLDASYFATSSEEMLIEFLGKAKFKSLDYDKQLLKVLKAAERVNYYSYLKKDFNV